MPDSTECNNSDDYTKNTCRNVVTISEILYGTGTYALQDVTTESKGSAGIRAYCWEKVLGCSDTDQTDGECLRGWKKTSTDTQN